MQSEKHMEKSKQRRENKLHKNRINNNEIDFNNQMDLITKKMKLLNINEKPEKPKKIKFIKIDPFYPLPPKYPL